MKNNKLIYIIMAIIIILIVVVVGLAIGSTLLKDDNNQNSEESTSTKVEEKKEETENNEESKIMFDWIGTYTNEDTTVYIEPISASSLEVRIDEVVPGDATYISYINVSDISKDELIGKPFGGTKIVKIKKNRNGISIESDIEGYSGDYKKDKFNSSEWTGIYQKNDITITLWGEKEDRTFYIIEYKSGEKHHSIHGAFIFYHEDKLEDEDEYEDFNDYNIQLEKKGDSIVVKATCEDEDNFLNEIDGTYEKIY